MQEKEDKKEQKTINVRDYKKIEDILDNDRLIKIYALLPTKEAKTEFLETVLSTYGDRLSEKFEDRLEDEFEASDSEVKQGYLKENIKNNRSITEVLRGRRREPLRQGVTERVNHLVTQLQEGNYISKEDIEFLARHLAGRPSKVGESPSSKRDEIRGIIDNYISARNREISNNANAFKSKQDLQSQIMKLKDKLRYKILHQNDTITHMEANGAFYGEDINEDPYIRVTKRREKEIQDIKSQIAQLEELQMIEATNNPLNSMMHTVDPEFDIGKNNEELQTLMDILDRESATLVGQGIKLPETGIREEDDIEIPIDDEQQTDKAEVPRDGETKADDKKVYVVNAQASLEQKYDKDGLGDVTIIEPTLGSSIEEFSEAIMNLKQNFKHIITRFNGFEIDSNAYQSPKEIVEAYMRHIQEHKNGTKELSSKQEQITPAEIESVVAIDPRALQIMRETSATKQLIQASEHGKNIEPEKE